MAFKKRTQLRSKAALLNQAKTPVEEDQVTNELPPDPKAFLHQYKESKREKLANRSQTFLSKLRGQVNDNGGISKSSLRRRKKKLREELKPKLNDLLTSLEEEGVLDSYSKPPEEKRKEGAKVTSFSASKAYTSLDSEQQHEPGLIKIHANEPSIRTQGGARLLAKKETSRFTKVMGDQSFQNNPFAALREVIKARSK